MSRYLNEVTLAVGQVIGLNETSAVGPETRLEDDLGFDSGLFIELIMDLEDRIPGLTIDPSTLRREDFLTVGTTAAFVEGLVQSPGAIP